MGSGEPEFSMRGRLCAQGDSQPTTIKFSSVNDPTNWNTIQEVVERLAKRLGVPAKTAIGDGSYDMLDLMEAFLREMDHALGRLDNGVASLASLWERRAAAEGGSPQTLEERLELLEWCVASTMPEEWKESGGAPIRTIKSAPGHSKHSEAIVRAVVERRKARVPHPAEDRSGPDLEERLALLEKSSLWCEEQIGELVQPPDGGEITDAMRRAGAAQMLHSAESPALGAARVYRAMCMARSDPPATG